MPRTPAHRRKRDPYRKQVLGVLKRPQTHQCLNCQDGALLEYGGPCCPVCGAPPICCEPGGCPTHQR